ncbi:hypothetical protein M569_06616 [Genlisea aurea]|uniref:HD-Zip IV C-terminal domain-containing protein n=1 Tax=Genlisea aurea TaxID=192259 RepID=S8E6W9_9LAMI|nr:hypothetical protein M569_06616 [Genlisea aurea]
MGKWSLITDDYDICTAAFKTNGQLVIRGFTTIWVNHSPNVMFSSLMQQSCGPIQWDALSNVEEVLRISTGSHQQDCVSVLRTYCNMTHDNTFILKYITTDSLIVYSSVNLDVLKLALGGGNVSHNLIAASGFTISSDLCGGSLVKIAI